MYDFTPLAMRHMEVRENWLVFLSSLVRIVGGIFVAVGLVSGCSVHSGAKSLRSRPLSSWISCSPASPAIQGGMVAAELLFGIARGFCGGWGGSMAFDWLNADDWLYLGFMKK